MKLFKNLFKKKTPKPEFMPDEELVAAIRTIMGDNVAEQVKHRIDTAEEHMADVAALEDDLMAVAQMRNNMWERYKRLAEILSEVNGRYCKLLLHLRDLCALTDEEKDWLKEFDEDICDTDDSTESDPTLEEREGDTEA